MNEHHYYAFEFFNHCVRIYLFVAKGTKLLCNLLFLYFTLKNMCTFIQARTEILHEGGGL